jgi:hypothetical protein
MSLGHTPSQTWLSIDGVNTYYQSGNGVRIIAYVNRVPFVYPSNCQSRMDEDWPENGSSDLQLPDTRARYIVRFEGTIRRERREEELGLVVLAGKAIAISRRLNYSNSFLDDVDNLGISDSPQKS